MPKHGFMTAKAIGNRIKAKGLQKLRWYCQMCAKQCRDENGFKCHTESESHQRQLLLVSEDPNKFVDNFSKEFEDGFLEQLRRTKGTKRVQANHMYQEFIAHKEHIHMNATKWRTLTEFVHHLGKSGACHVDETPKGYFIQFIDRDPEVIARQKEMERRGRAEHDEADRQAKVIREMIEKDKERKVANGIEEEEATPTALVRDENAESVKISFSKATPGVKPETAVLDFKTQLKAAAAASKGTISKVVVNGGNKRKKTALELIKEEEEERKRKKMEQEMTSASNRKDYWLKKGIVVKVMNKKLANGKYYKCKGVVQEVVHKYGAKIALLDSKAVLTLDQEDLETVIPKPGALVMIVNGPHRGIEAKLESLQTEKFSCTVTLLDGSRKGKTFPRIAYEDLCKLHV